MMVELEPGCRLDEEVGSPVIRGDGLESNRPYELRFTNEELANQKVPLVCTKLDSSRW